MKKYLTKLILLSAIMSFISFSGFVIFSTPVQAQTESICIPSACPNDYEPDFNCINERLFNPDSTCCQNKCKGSAGAPNVTTPEIQPLIRFFGRTLAIREASQLPVIINLAITTFLGFVSVYAVVYGIYVAGFIRARTTNEEEIQKANKTLIYLFAGFILAWSFIIIIQLIANVLGLGSLNNLVVVDSGGGSGTNIVIQ